MRDADDGDWLGLLPDDDDERPESRRRSSPPADAYGPPASRPSRGAYGGAATTTATDDDVWLAPAAAGPAPDTARTVRRRRRLYRTALIAIAAFVLLAFALGPQIARNMVTSVADGDTAITLSSGGDQVTIVAPDGWHIVRPFANGSTVALETPDSRAEISLTLTHRPGAETPPDAAALAGDAHDVADDQWSVEPPNAGTSATYVVLAQPESFGASGLFGTGLFSDGSPAQPAVVAAVVPAPPHASGAVVDVLATSDVPFEPYLAEFAAVVASVEFTS